MSVCNYLLLTTDCIEWIIIENRHITHARRFEIGYIDIEGVLMFV
jgi:hypothetical protein